MGARCLACPTAVDWLQLQLGGENVHVHNNNNRIVTKFVSVFVNLCQSGTTALISITNIEQCSDNVCF